MKIGFLGAGRISEVVAPAVAQAEGVQRCAVAARDQRRLPRNGDFRRLMEVMRR